MTVGPASYDPARTVDYAPRWREYQTAVELREAGTVREPEDMTALAPEPPVWLHRRRALRAPSFGLRNLTRDDKARLAQQVRAMCGSVYAPPNAWWQRLSVDDVCEILRIATAVKITERARVEDWYR